MTPLTAPCVPTGMNAGVSTSPCAVVITPRRAQPSVAISAETKAWHREENSLQSLKLHQVDAEDTETSFTTKITKNTMEAADMAFVIFVVQIAPSVSSVVES